MIKTARLDIVPMTISLASRRYVDWLNDPEVTRFSSQRHRVHSLDSVQAFISSFAGTPNRFWALIVVANGVHVGTATHYVDVANRSADIGIMIGDRDLWGKGYGREAWVALMRYGFETLELERITGGCASGNIGMRRIFEAANMTAVPLGSSNSIVTDYDDTVVRYFAIKDRWLNPTVT